MREGKTVLGARSLINQGITELKVRAREISDLRGGKSELPGEMSSALPGTSGTNGTRPARRLVSSAALRAHVPPEEGGKHVGSGLEISKWQ